MTGVDIHAHIVPATFPASVRPNVAGWPGMEAQDSCHRNIIIDGKVYRTLSDKCWTISKRLEDMDRMGIAVQAISPMPELFSCWMDAASATDLLCYVNDQIAAFVAEANGRMLVLGAIPLQDIDLALEEMRRLKDLGFAGVEIGSNLNGEPLGSTRFEPFAFHEKDPIARLRETFSGEQLHNRLICKNARTFLKIGEAHV